MTLPFPARPHDFEAGCAGCLAPETLDHAYGRAFPNRVISDLPQYHVHILRPLSFVFASVSVGFCLMSSLTNRPAAAAAAAAVVLAVDHGDRAGHPRGQGRSPRSGGGVDDFCSARSERRG